MIVQSKPQMTQFSIIDKGIEFFLLMQVYEGNLSNKRHYSRGMFLLWTVPKLPINMINIHGHQRKHFCEHKISHIVFKTLSGAYGFVNNESNT